jgi:hypothetical protein
MKKMKRFLLFVAACFIIYIVYYDLTSGSLPSMHAKADQPSDKALNEKVEPTSIIPFKMVQIKPGDTLLSIVEKQGHGINTSIEDVVADFISLNNGLQPELIQIGKTYKIPQYE